ncbi:hypothetical protein E8E12_000511 [Didymella heteroderae]|uniref:Uncharacterized protein n=1 Tax=Didymella heteroderae TaxID=1769908 RepID=A0A9P5C172_9PLEO|nr:hypothetical protein E8E12_000511 [Didymella heteroderae]
MPYYHQSEGTTHSTSIPIGSQFDGPDDYRPQMKTFNAHGRPNSQSLHQQRYPAQQYSQEQHPQQQSHHQRSLHPQMQAMAAPHGPSKPHKPAAESAVTTLLPYCSADVALNGSQVIAVTDVAGSLKELVLLALGAKNGNEDCMHVLRSALGGEQISAGIVDFFSDEFEVE